MQSIEYNNKAHIYGHPMEFQNQDKHTGVKGKWEDMHNNFRQYEVKLSTLSIGLEDWKRL